MISLFGRLFASLLQNRKRKDKSVASRAFAPEARMRVVFRHSRTVVFGRAAPLALRQTLSRAQPQRNENEQQGRWWGRNYFTPTQKRHRNVCVVPKKTKSAFELGGSADDLRCPPLSSSSSSSVSLSLSLVRACVRRARPPRYGFLPSLLSLSLLSLRCAMRCDRYTWTLVVLKTHSTLGEKTSGASCSPASRNNRLTNGSHAKNDRELHTRLPE